MQLFFKFQIFWKNEKNDSKNNNRSCEASQYEPKLFVSRMSLQFSGMLSLSVKVVVSKIRNLEFQNLWTIVIVTGCPCFLSVPSSSCVFLQKTLELDGLSSLGGGDSEKIGSKFQELSLFVKVRKWKRGIKLHKAGSGHDSSRPRTETPLAGRPKGLG